MVMGLEIFLIFNVYHVSENFVLGFIQFSFCFMQVKTSGFICYYFEY